MAVIFKPKMCDVPASQIFEIFTILPLTYQKFSRKHQIFQHYIQLLDAESALCSKLESWFTTLNYGQMIPQTCKWEYNQNKIITLHIKYCKMCKKFIVIYYSHLHVLRNISIMLPYSWVVWM